MSQIEKTDVCIIGAGPSGAATSIMLSKSKIPHYIVDKSTFPRDKTCGDGLILYAYKAMKLLGEELFEEFLKNPNFLHSKTIKLHINNSQNITFRESEERDMVISYAKRLDFDYFLVNHLSRKYARQNFGDDVKEVKQLPERVLVRLKSGKEILAKMVVGADGANSIVSRKLAKNKVDLKLKSTFVSAYFKDVIDLSTDNCAEVRLIYKKTLLFFYVFPLADGQVNVSLGGRSDLIKKNDIHLVDEINTIINSNNKVKHKFKNATKVSPWRGWTIPFHFKKQIITGNRFLLVGDAAGLANAFYKEGVGTGMMSGIIAAKNIERCLKENNFSKTILKKYEIDLANEFGKLLTFSKFMLRIAKFKRLFFIIIAFLKGRVERKSFKIIERRSY